MAKITHTQIQNSAFSLDDFRSMVNYDYGKNKGYVRLTKEGNKLVLQKYNNKLDLNASFHSNMDGQACQALRTKLLNALTSKMTGASEYQIGKIRELLLGKTENSPVASKPLSRREVRNAFYIFDGEMNTPDARRSCASRVLDQIYDRAKGMYLEHFKNATFMDKDAFLKKYMQLENGIRSPAFDGMYDEEDLNVPFYDQNDPKNIQLAKEGKIVLAETKLEHFNRMEEIKAKDKVQTGEHDVHGARATKPMLKPVDTFVSLLKSLAITADNAFKLIEAEISIHQKIAEAMKAKVELKVDPNDPFAGSGLTAATKTQIQTSLKSILRLTCTNSDMVVGNVSVGGTKVLDVFVDRVLPSMVRSARLQAELDSRANEKVDRSVYLSVDDIIDSAKEFLNEYAALENGLKGAAEGKSGKEASNAQADFMKVWIGNMMENVSETAFFMDVRESLVLHAGMNKQDRKDTGVIEMLMKDYGAASAESRMEHFAKSFVQKKCPNVNLDFDKEPKSADELAHERLKDVTLAAKLNYGERWLIGEKKLKQGWDAATFLEKANDLVVKAVNYYCDGDMEDMVEMCNTLGEARVAKLMNEKIRHAAKTDGAQTRVHMEKEDVENMEGNLQAAAKLYIEFTKKGSVRMLAQFNKMKKQMIAEVKDNRLTLDQAKSILKDTFLPTQRALMREARAAFLRMLPSDALKTSAEVKSFVKEYEGEVDEQIKVALSEASSIVQERIALEKLSNTHLSREATGSIRKATPVSAFIGSCGDLALGNRMRPALERLYHSIADELIGKSKQAKSGGLDKTKTAELLKRIEGEFNTDAAKLFSTVKGLKEKAKAFIADAVDGYLTAQFSKDYNEDADYLPYANELTRDEKTSLRNTLSAEVVSRLEDEVDELFENVVRNPPAFKKLGDIKARIENELLKTAGDRSVQGILKKIATERMEAINKWTIPNGFKDEKAALGVTKNFIDRNCAAEALTQIRNELGIKGDDKALASGMNEIIRGFRDKLAARVRNLPLHYASTLSVDNLKAKLTGELAAMAKDQIKKFAGAWQKFLGGKTKSRTVETYGSNISEEDVRGILAELASQIAMSQDGKNFTADAMGKLFVKMMAGCLEGKIFDKECGADAYLQKIDDAMKFVEQAKNGFRKTFLDWAKKTNAPNDVIEYFTTVIEPRFNESMYNKVCLDPDQFLGTVGPHTTAADLAEKLTMSLDAVDVGQTDHFDDMIAESGVASRARFKVDGKVQAVPEEAKERMRNNVAVFVKLPRIANQRSELLKAQLELQYQMDVEKIEYEKTPVELRDRIDRFEDEIQGICNPVIGEINFVNFCKCDFQEALVQFNAWLDGYNAVYPLPTDLHNGKSVRDLAIDLFTRRFNEISQKLINNESLRSGDDRQINLQFLLDLSQLFATTAVELVINRELTDRFVQKLKDFDDRSFKENRCRCYSMSDELAKHEKDPAYKPIVDAIKHNADILHMQVVENMNRAREYLTSNLRSYEEMARDFDGFVTKKMAAYLNINSYGLANESSNRVIAAEAAVEGLKFQMAKLNDYITNAESVLKSIPDDVKGVKTVREQSKAILEQMRTNVEQRIKLDYARLCTYSENMTGLTDVEARKLAEDFRNQSEMTVFIRFVQKLGLIEKHNLGLSAVKEWLDAFGKVLNTEKGKVAYDTFFSKKDVSFQV